MRLKGATTPPCRLREEKEDRQCRSGQKRWAARVFRLGQRQPFTSTLDSREGRGKQSGRWETQRKRQAGGYGGAAEIESGERISRSA